MRSSLIPVGKARRGSIVLALVLVLASLAGACNPAPVTSTSPMTTAATFGQLAQAGQPSYVAACASCHGADGQGVDAPALWGAQARLGKYSTAQGLLSYISATMPQDAPGSLSHQAYLNILGYLLLQSGDATPSTPFSETDLPNVTLK